ncbi:hypothetical protein [Persephonella sp.]
MRNIFIISRPKDFYISKRRLYLSIRKENYSISVKEIETIFILTGFRIPKKAVEELEVPIYKINDTGHIEKIYLPPKELTYLDNIPEISRKVCKLNILQIRGYLNYLSKFQRRFYRQLYNNKLYDLIDEKNYYNITPEITFAELANLHKSIVYDSINFHRSYTSRRKNNITMNIIHSLYISFITTYLIKKGINPYQELPFKKKNYPNMSVLLFNLLKINAIMLSNKIFQDIILESEDFEENHALYKLAYTGKLVISKIFSEKVLHNTKLRDRFDYFYKITTADTIEP